MKDKKAFDKLNDRFVTTLIKFNHQLNNCIKNQAFEEAATIRDDIKELIDTSAHLLSPLKGKPVDDMLQLLNKANDNIRQEFEKNG